MTVSTTSYYGTRDITIRPCSISLHDNAVMPSRPRKLNPIPPQSVRAATDRACFSLAANGSLLTRLALPCAYDLEANRSKNRKTLGLEQPLDKRQRIESVYLGYFTTDEICARAN